MEKIIKLSVPDKIIESQIYELVKETRLICVINGHIYVKETHNIWRPVSDSVAMIRVRDMFEKEDWQSHLNHSLVGRIVKSLKTDPDLQGELAELKHEELILFVNGIWSIAEKKLYKDINNIKFGRVVNASIKTTRNASTPVFDRFCKKVFKAEECMNKKKILYEIIGYCISDITNVKKAVIFLGPSNCGKSVILRFIQRLVGEEDVSNVSLSSFSEKFSLVEMYGKNINISGEIPSVALPGRALDVLKSITGGDRIELERKGCQPFPATLDTKLLFAGNTIPTFSKIDGSHSLVERLHILIFDNVVKEEERDSELEEKLWNERNEIVYNALLAIGDFLERKKIFLVTNDEKKLLECMKQVANPIAHFIEECLVFDESYEVHITDVYDAYIKFASSEALPVMERVAFRNLMSMQNGVHISKTKKRLGKSSPRACFKGIKLKDNEKRDV